MIIDLNTQSLWFVPLKGKPRLIYVLDVIGQTIRVVKKRKGGVTEFMTLYLKMTPGRIEVREGRM